MPAHAGKSGSDHPAHAEFVHFKHLPTLLLFAFFHCSEIANSCVVDQHVDAAEVLLGGMNRGIDLALIP